MTVMDFYDKPVEGVPMIEPKHPPATGQVVIGYELLHTDKGCFTKPHPKRLNKFGWIGVIALALLCWPASCIPCCMSCSYDKCQRPVYGTTTTNTHKNIDPKDQAQESLPRHVLSASTPDGTKE